MWCSTRIDWWGNHVSGDGNYGNCVETPSCELTCKTNGDASAPRPKATCAFPFTFDGVTYDENTGCAPDANHAGGWCSTQTDLFDQHISGNWGYCNTEGCPQANPVVAAAPEGDCVEGSDGCLQSKAFADSSCTTQIGGYPLFQSSSRPSGSCHARTYEFEPNNTVHRNWCTCDDATDTFTFRPGCSSCSFSGECMPLPGASSTVPPEVPLRLNRCEGPFPGAPAPDGSSTEYWVITSGKCAKPVETLALTPDSSLCELGSDDCVQASYYTDSECSTTPIIEYPSNPADGTCSAWTFSGDAALGLPLGFVHRSKLTCDPATNSVTALTGCDTCMTDGQCTGANVRTLVGNVGECRALPVIETVQEGAPQIYFRVTDRKSVV